MYGCGRSHHTRWLVVFAPLFTMSVVSNVFAAERTPQRAETVRLPDLSSYNCAGVDAAAAPGDRHMGQVINGKYFDWHAIYGAVDGKRRLLCISVDKPMAHQLTRDEALAFLTESFAVGRPNPPAANAAPIETPQEPDNVRPMPLPHVKKPTTATPETQQQSTTPELPPRPATKSGDDASAPRAAVETQKSTAESAEPKITGVDERVVVSNTQAFPWNTIGLLSITYPSGGSYRCSGTLVSPYVVLTAGHCLHDKTLGGYVATARFYPGQYQRTLGDGAPIRPYGGKTDVANYNVTQTWTQISGADSYPVTDYKNDFASIQFKTAFTFTSTFMPVIYSSTDTPVTNAGYPGVVQNVSALGLWTDSGADISGNFLRNNHVREFGIDATGGDSGSPFFFVDPETGQRSVVGSLSYSDDLDDDAGGPWYDSWNKGLLSTWIAWTPAATTAGSVAGLHVPNVFSTSWKDIQSHVRFYNGSTTAGTVQVTLADVATGAALATWTSPSIPAGAAPQFYMKTIEDNATPAGFTKPLFYALSIRPTFSGFFQHVVFQIPQQSVQNWSVCDTGAVASPTILPSVNSSSLAAFPGSFGIHNTGTSNITVAIGIFNADTGSRLGTYTSPTIPPNGEILAHSSDMEASAHVTPSATTYRYVLKADSAFTGYLVGYSTNNANGVVTDASTMCTLSP